MRVATQFISFAGHFVLSLVLLTTVLGVAGTFADFRMPPRGVAIAFALILLASAAIGVIKARLAGRRYDAQSAPPPPTAKVERARTVQPAHEPAAAPPNSPADPAIAKAWGRPIVFRELFPPPADGGLSYYGGLPTGPLGMEWPRHAFAEGDAPLSFLIQWDCRDLAAQDATGLLPRDGVLYLFCDLAWRDHEAFRFIHAPGDPAAWEPLRAPDDMGPILGSETAWQVPYCSQRVPAEQQDCPRLLPKWPFRPLGFAYPPGAEREPDEVEFWNEGLVKDALIEVQNSLGEPLAVFEPERSERQTGRPFAAFPHDWAAVRIVCAKVLDPLRSSGQIGGIPALRELDEETRAKRIKQWREEAIELYIFATRHPLGGAVPQALSDQIWSWMEQVESCVSLTQELLTAVNCSLGLRSEAVGAIPPALVARASLSHALGHRYTRLEYPHETAARLKDGTDTQQQIRDREAMVARGEIPTIADSHANTPNRIFGRPSDVQGYSEEYMADHLLLFEISSSPQLGIELGEGVIQYMIRPADLAAGRFDKVVVVASAY